MWGGRSLGGGYVYNGFYFVVKWKGKRFGQDVGLMEIAGSFDK